MMPKNKLIFTCKKENETVELGKKISKLCRQGDVFALQGTLGMGKSVFARAIIQNLCGMTEVPSPTFTLVQVYDAPDFPIYHFDLYRLKSAEEIFELGIEEAMYEGVCLIEWSEKMEGYLPLKAIRVNITPDGQNRNFEFNFNSVETYQRFLPLKD